MKKDGWIKLNEAGELWEGLMVVWPTCFIPQMKRSSVLESFTFLILLLCLSQAIWVSWTGCEQSQKELTHSREFMLELKQKGVKELWIVSFYNLFFQTVWNGLLSELLQNKKKDLERYDMNSKTHIPVKLPGRSETSVAIQQLLNIKRVCACKKCIFCISSNLWKWSKTEKQCFILTNTEWKSSFSLSLL